MKTTEEKARAIDIVKQMIADGQVSQEVAEKYFLELKESKNGDNKRISKEITQFLKQNNGWNREWLAWLEKQGEQKQLKDYSTLEITDVVRQALQECESFSNIRADLYAASVGATVEYLIKKRSEQRSAEKVEPKFHKGEWVIGRATENEPRQIAEITEEGYKTTYGGWIGFSFEEDMHLWTLDDAKDGNIIATSAGAFIYNGKRGGSCPGSYCGINTLGRFQTGSETHWTGKKVYPATKEQRDTLFAKMKEAGCAFDFEKKELKKLGQSEVTKTSDQEEIAGIPFGAKDSELQEATYFIPKGFHAEIDNDKVVIKKGEKPTAWSEEDEKRIANILSVLSVQVCWDGATGEKMNPYQKEIDWLKSLKDRVQPKQEWSEDDKKMLESIIYDFGKGRQSTTSQDNWLKSLAPWSIPKIRFV